MGFQKRGLTKPQNWGSSTVLVFKSYGLSDLGSLNSGNPSNLDFPFIQKFSSLEKPPNFALDTKSLGTKGRRPNNPDNRKKRKKKEKKEKMKKRKEVKKERKKKKKKGKKKKRRRRREQGRKE